MSGLSDTIKGFYSDFILRDLLSFVTPGAIISGVTFFALSMYSIQNNSPNVTWQTLCLMIGSVIWSVFNLPWYIWILFFGFFYIIGLGIQCFGEMIRLLQFPPERYENIYWHCSEDFSQNEKERNSKYYDILRLKFIQTTPVTKEENCNIERKTHERFIVLMQACGNCALAFFMTSLVILCVASMDSVYCDSNHVDRFLGILLLVLIIAILYFLKKRCYQKFPICELAFLVIGILMIILLPMGLGAHICNMPLLISGSLFFIAGIFLYYGYELHRQRLLDWELSVIKRSDC